MVFEESSKKVLKYGLPLNFFIALVLILYYTKIKKRLAEVILKNDENLKIINSYVPSSIANKNGKIIYVNKAFCKLTGYMEDELLGKNHSILKSGKQTPAFYKEMWETLHSGKTWSGELENIRKNGQTYWIEMIIYPKTNEETFEREYLSISHNISDKKLLDKLAYTDHLTDLANRKKIDIELNKVIYKSKRYKIKSSLMILDIDFFKKVNDTHGHNIGDSVLVEISNILKKSIRKTDIAGRWGGEEFIIITPNIDANECLKMAKKINKEIDEYSFNFTKHQTVSIGVTEILENDNIYTSIERADKNLYKAKESGRNQVIGDC